MVSKIWNVAAILLSWLTIKEIGLSVDNTSPVQPANFHPKAGIAVNVTSVP
ncbi:MAG: hypothetical protein IGBAC_0323 [Ignavibacteriae bacterium]|nr:MAG: hypothetical protein IGBAC_0323 [Ignavibacteriota bacterium]